MKHHWDEHSKSVEIAQSAPSSNALLSKKRSIGTIPNGGYSSEG